MKLSTQFISRTKTNYPKRLIISEYTLNIEVILPSKYCLCQQLFVNKTFWTKWRLYNTFKIANSMTLTKANLENPDKVLQRQQKIYPKTVQGFFISR